MTNIKTKKKKILITGSSGFLGQVAINYFKKNYNLILVDKKILHKKDFYKVDITNYLAIEDLIYNKRPDIIIHLASEIFDINNKAEIDNNNVNGTINLLKAVEKFKIKNFVFTSTFSIFEKDYSELINESEPISCNNLYGLSKAEAERILLSSNKNLNITIFRCPVILDKTRAHRLGILFEFLKNNCALWILGQGENKIQFLSATDLMSMIEKSFKLKGKHIFNIGTEKNFTVKEIFHFLIKKTQSKSKVLHLNKKIGLLFLKILSSLKLINFIDYHNKLLVSNIVMDISRIKRELFYNPKKSNAELLLEAYKFYNKKKNHLKFGSGKKPEMGFFIIIKFFSRFF